MSSEGGSPPRRPAPPPPWSHGPREPTHARPPPKPLPEVTPQPEVTPPLEPTTSRYAPAPAEPAVPAAPFAPAPSAPTARTPSPPLARPAKPTTPPAPAPATEPAPAAAAVAVSDAPPPKLAPPPVAAPRPPSVVAIAPPAPSSSTSATSLPLLAPPEGPRPAPPPDPTAERTVARRAYVAFLRASLRRAFTTNVSPADVLPEERAALTLVAPPIIDTAHQAFLVWRRSVLLAIAAALVLLGIFRIVELARVSGPLDDGSALSLRVLPLVAELFAAAVAWVQLTRWTGWTRQRRIVAGAALVYFAAPFVAYLYPVRSFYGEPAEGYGFLVAIQALLLIAPRVAALAPGIARGLRLTPRHERTHQILAGAGALATYLALLVPYQVTASGWFVGAMIALTAGQLAIASTHQHARTASAALLGAGGLFAAIAVLHGHLEVDIFGVIGAALAYAVTYLFATLVTADIVESSARVLPPPK